MSKTYKGYDIMDCDYADNIEAGWRYYIRTVDGDLSWDEQLCPRYRTLADAKADINDRIARSHAAAAMGRSRSEAKTKAARDNGRKGGRPRHTDYDRVLTLGYPRGVQNEGDECPSCGETATWLSCADCNRAAFIIDCEHYAQPRPLAGGKHGSDVTCADCERQRDADAETE